LSLPPGNEMFQFPGFASLACAQDDRSCDRPGFPIRKSWDHSLFAAPPGLSQLTTSFVASLCQGIHRAPLRACSQCLGVIPQHHNTHTRQLSKNEKKKMVERGKCGRRFRGLSSPALTDGAYSALQKGGDPAAGSPTATLLRLRPSN